MANLHKEFEFYLEHEKELLDSCKGRVVVIKGQAVIGTFDSELEAIEKTSETHELGTFLVQVCGPSGNGNAQIYHSRAIFT